MVPQQATVIRDGEFVSAKCEDIVVGDIVQITAGWYRVTYGIATVRNPLLLFLAGNTIYRRQ